MSDGCSLCDGEGEDFKARLEAMRRKQESDILEWGVSLQGVRGDRDSPPFIYSMGLTDVGWPELIMMGIQSEHAFSTLNHVFQEYLRLDLAPQRGDVLTNFLQKGIQLRLGTVGRARLDHYLTQTVGRQMRVRGPEPSALQIIWPDARNVFPGHDEYDLQFIERQLCLTDTGVWDYEPEASEIVAGLYHPALLKRLAQEKREGAGK